jgi:hypothetical protein
MQKKEIIGKTEGIAKVNKMQGLLNNINNKNKIFSNENDIFNEYIPENNNLNDIEILRPTPLRNYKDTFFLGKKRAGNKGLFQYNNYYKNNNDKLYNCAFKSFNCCEKSKNIIYPFFNPDFMKIKQNFFNSNNHQEKKKTLNKSQTQIKINVIINNYNINTDRSFIKENNEDINNKKAIFGITNNKSEHSEIVKTPKSSCTMNTTNSQNTNKATKNISFKKFEIIKTDNLNEIDILKLDEIKKISKKRKRGRKPLKESKRQHNALDQDNIIRKIQVHFLSFIIYFCNDLIQVILPNNKDLSFKNINYELKKTVNHAYIEKLKSQKIGDILQLKASPKNKKFDGNINQKTFEKICNMNQFLKNFFEMSYLDMFNNYYCINEREVNVEEYKVKLSQKTRLFIDLIEKNKSSAEKIREIAEQYFINKKRNLNNPFFVIKKSDNVI